MSNGPRAKNKSKKRLVNKGQGEKVFTRSRKGSIEIELIRHKILRGPRKNKGKVMKVKKKS